jgi:serine/threonine protein kinase
MSNSAVGTFRYMSPERLNNSYYHHGGDIWYVLHDLFPCPDCHLCGHTFSVNRSVGVMMIELWNKRYPFESAGHNPIELITEFENLNMTALLESYTTMSRSMKEVIW